MKVSPYLRAAGVKIKMDAGCELSKKPLIKTIQRVLLQPQRRDGQAFALNSFIASFFERKLSLRIFGYFVGGYLIWDPLAENVGTCNKGKAGKFKIPLDRKPLGSVVFCA